VRQKFGVVDIMLSYYYFHFMKMMEARFSLILPDSATHHIYAEISSMSKIFVAVEDMRHRQAGRYGDEVMSVMFTRHTP
jgi:hypothetical protein